MPEPLNAWGSRGRAAWVVRCPGINGHLAVLGFYYFGKVAFLRARLRTPGLGWQTAVTGSTGVEFDNSFGGRAAHRNSLKKFSSENFDTTQGSLGEGSKCSSFDVRLFSSN